MSCKLCLVLTTESTWARRSFILIWKQEKHYYSLKIIEFKMFNLLLIYQFKKFSLKLWPIFCNIFVFLYPSHTVWSRAFNYCYMIPCKTYLNLMNIFFLISSTSSPSFSLLITLIFLLSQSVSPLLLWKWISLNSIMYMASNYPAPKFEMSKSQNMPLCIKCCGKTFNVKEAGFTNTLK